VLHTQDADKKPREMMNHDVKKNDDDANSHEAGHHLELSHDEELECGRRRREDDHKPTGNRQKVKPTIRKRNRNIESRIFGSWTHHEGDATSKKSTCLSWRRWEAAQIQEGLGPK
jgi:hypothetical protein